MAVKAAAGLQDRDVAGPFVRRTGWKAGPKSMKAAYPTTSGRLVGS